MKIKTSELIGPALNWAVAKCEGTLGLQPRRCFDCRYFEERHGVDDPIYYCHHPKSQHDMEFGWANAISPDYGTHPECPHSDQTPEPYSTDWSLAGPIIEREGIATGRPSGRHWAAWDMSLAATDKWFGPTPLVAAMRCFVASKLGDEVDVPEELLK